MEEITPMAKTTFNGIHIDLSDISMISRLEKRQGEWIASIVWRQTGAAINLKMATVADQFTIIQSDQQIKEEQEAKDNYDRLVAEWKQSS
jgi:hypothetical protein